MIMLAHLLCESPAKWGEMYTLHMLTQTHTHASRLQLDRHTTHMAKLNVHTYVYTVCIYTVLTSLQSCKMVWLGETT